MVRRRAVSTGNLNKAKKPQEGYFFKTRPAKLVLSDKTVFAGQSPGWQSDSQIGEVVFNTGMTGYVESLTDPSYAGQILVFTYPLIGNYGVPAPRFWESDKIQVAGVVVDEMCENWSHSNSHKSLVDWLREQSVVLLTGVDTRTLTKHLRSRGTMMGTIATSGQAHLAGLGWPKIKVTVTRPTTYNPRGRKKVILVDCGAKNNILRSVLKYPVQVNRVPYDYDYTNEAYDGVVISNGPGDPEDYGQTVEITKKVLTGRRPVFGICLGSQIMGLAAGAKTYKLLFGHRGHNQPCQNQLDGRCVVTSQNHGYAVDEASLPKNWRVNYRNLNDNSVEGLEHKNRPFFSVQFHPEASPGPTDSSWLFEKFYNYL